MNSIIMQEYTRLVDYLIDLEKSDSHPVFFMAYAIDMIYFDERPARILRVLREEFDGSSLAPLADIADLLQINSEA